MSKSSDSSKQLKAELAALRREVAQLRSGTDDDAGDAPAKKASRPKSGGSRAASNKSGSAADSSTAQRNGKQPPERSRAGKKPSTDRGHDSRRGLFSGAVFRWFGAWGLSVITHLAIFIALGLWMLPGLLETSVPEMVAVQETPDEELHQTLDVLTQPTTSLAASTAHGAITQGHSMRLDGIAEPSLDETIAELSENPTVNVESLSIDALAGQPIHVPVSADTPGDPHAVVDGYDEAMDRLTREILLMLEQGKVLLVWCFDQSESMKDDQEDIKSRISKVYKELGLHGAHDNGALQTVVVSYGARSKLHTPQPTSNVEAIERAIDEIPIDKTGAEMMCQTVGQTIQRFQSIAASTRRQMALVLVTDESGDKETNVTQLEAVIGVAKSARCRIYALGRESVFGYLYAHYLWKHPQTGHIHKIPIDRGPETPYAEQLQTSGFRRRYDSHPSGFGPYEQARMARETGGIFFMLPSIETNLVQDDANALRLVEAGQMSREEYRKQLGAKRRFQLEALRPYMPSLEARHIYAGHRDQSPMRKALWTVITNLNPYDPEKEKVIEMRLRFSGTPATFGTEVLEEHRKATLYFEFLKLAEERLAELAAVRSREVYPRWQANYDLMYAQVLAYKVRLYEYKAYLETFAGAVNRNPDVREQAIALLGKDPRTFPLQKPHPNKQPGHFLVLAYWEMVQRPETITGEVTKADIERSRKLFESVISNHPDTPWADRAVWELQRGYGVELLPRYHHRGPPTKRPPGKPQKLIPVPKL